MSYQEGEQPDTLGSHILLRCSVHQHSIGASEKGPLHSLHTHDDQFVSLVFTHILLCVHNVYMYMHILVLCYRSNMYTLDIFIKRNKNQL